MTTIPEVPSTHEDNAHAIRLELQRLVQGIRGFSLLTTEGRRAVTVTGHVDDDFLRNMALLLDAHPDIVTPSRITGAELRDHLSFMSAHQGVGEELMLNGRKMVDTLVAERADVGERALLALKIARNMSTPSARAALVPHLEAIDRDFSRGRRKRVSKKKADETAVPPKKEVKP
jgi:hypothetical protein